MQNALFQCPQELAGSHFEKEESLMRFNCLLKVYTENQTSENHLAVMSQRALTSHVTSTKAMFNPRLCPLPNGKAANKAPQQRHKAAANCPQTALIFLILELSLVHKFSIPTLSLIPHPGGLLNQ